MDAASFDEVDQGLTGCKTPETRSYIARTWARRKARTSKKTASGQKAAFARGARR